MKKTVIRIILISFFVSLGLELTIFNIKHYQSLFFPKTIKYNNDKQIKKNKLYSNNVEINIQDDDAIEIKNINRKVRNIYIEGSSKSPSKINILLKDEGNGEYYNAGGAIWVDDIKQTNYISIHPMGKISAIKLDIRSTDSINIKNIYLNAKVPFNINYIRIIIVFIICYMGLYIKNIKPFEKSYKEYIPFLILWIGIISISIFFFVNLSNYGKDSYDFEHVNQNYQYQLLARMLAKGRVTMDLDVSDKFLALDNPYDVSVRDKALIVNEDYYLDYAFYKGKYYSYFGIVPCLFMHLPFFLITHHDLNNSFAMTFTCIFYVISAFFVTYQLFNRYYPKAKFKYYLVFGLLVALLSGISMIVRKGYFYGIPIAFGAALAMMGIGFWLKASSDEKKINTKYLVLGSIMFALVPGCRPQIFIAVLLGIPLFWKYLKNKELFRLKNILAIVIPMIIAASLLMYYNYIRFGNVFDFGANYNLTSNDMTKRGFYFDRIITGLFAFLFEVPRINLVFPYVHAYNIETNYIGITIHEQMIGGMFLLNMLTIVNLFIFKIKKYIESKEEFVISLLAIICSLILIIVDVQMAGILPRYICDFGFLLSISAVILWMNLLNHFKNNKRLIFKVIVWLLVICIIYNFLSFFTDGFTPVIYNTYKRFYLAFYYLFSFGV